MNKKSLGAIGFIIFLVGSGLISLAPTGVAQVPVLPWTKHVIQGQTGGLDSLDLSSDGDTGKIGIAVRRSNNDILFAIGDNETGFSVVNDTVATSVVSGPEVYKINDTQWGMVYYNGTSWHFILSIDGGLTWNLTHSDAGALPTIDGKGDVILIGAKTTSGTTHNVHASFDRGLSWGIILTESALAGSTYEIYAVSNAIYYLYAAVAGPGDGNSFLYRRTEDAGSFWTSYTKIDDGGNLNSCTATAPNIEGNGPNLVAFWTFSPTGTCSASDNGRYIFPEGTKTLDVGGINSKNQFDRNSNGQIFWVSTAGFGAQYSTCNPTCTFNNVDFGGANPSDVSDIRESVNLQNDRVYIVYSNDTFGGRLEVLTAEIGAAPPTPEDADNTVALTGIVGFDTSKNGEFIVVRDENGSHVKTYNGETLALINDFGDTECVKTDGVAAILDAGIAYFDCTNLGNDITNLHIKDRFGDDYPLSCSGTSGCASLTFDLDDLDDENNFVDLVLLGPGPITSLGSDSQDRINSFNFLIGGGDGRIFNLGVAAIDSRYASSSGSDIAPVGGNFQDIEEFALNYAASAVSDICAPQGIALQGYAVEVDQQTRGYIATETKNVNQDFIPTYDTSISQNFVGTSPINQQTHIACSLNSIYTATSGGGSSIKKVNPSTGAVLWTVVGEASILSITASKNDEWVAYTTATNTYLLYGSNGTVNAEFNNPSGTVVETELDYFGQHLYVVTQTNIAYFDLFDETGGPVSATTTTTTSATTTGLAGDCLGCTPLPPGSKPFGIDVNWVAEGLQISVVGVQVLIGLILCVIFAIWLYKGTGSIVAAILGIGLGLAVATVIGLVPPWVVMAIVLAMLIILGKMLFGGFAGGEES